MTVMIIGMVLFFGIHFVPLTPLNQKLIDRFGFNGYRGVFSIFAAVGLGLLIWGYSMIPYEEVWLPITGAREISLIAMPIALILLVTGNLKSNINRFIPHPMLTGILIWAATHLLANGDLAALLLFGSFGLYAIIDMAYTDKTSAKEKQPLSRDALVVAIGLGAYALLLYFHDYVAGVPVI